MKKTIGIIAVLFALAIAAQASAANSVNVAGDLARDGSLTIDIAWKVDTAKYKGMAPEQVRQQVYEEIWKETFPKLARKTEGMAVSYDKSNFTKLSENKNLVEQRADGTKVVDYTATVRFQCPIAQGEKAKGGKAHEAATEQEYHYRFVREGID